MSQVNASIRKHAQREQQRVVAPTPDATDTAATESTKEWTRGEKTIVGVAIGIVAASVGVVIFSLLTMEP